MSRDLRRAAWILLLIAALGTTAILAQDAPKTAAPQPTARTLEPPSGVLGAAGNAPDLIFLYTGDVIGSIEPCG